MYYTEPEPEPLPPLVRRLLIALALIIAAVYLAVYIGLPALFALNYGWHPLPGTRLGCALHKRFHGGTGVVSSEQLGFRTSCLIVRRQGRSYTITDQQRITAIRAWIDERSDLWLENILTIGSGGESLAAIRPCHRPDGTLQIEIYVTEDWLGDSPSKRYQRPICRDEPRQLLEILGREPD
jgi:hypothetical protein